MLPLTLLIKLQDSGPLFYGHRRIAIAGKEVFMPEVQDHARGCRQEVG
jgi:lipopolysaccharide/colanic/teichoic acid biosynthesis glycosyltransferase